MTVTVLLNTQKECVFSAINAAIGESARHIRFYVRSTIITKTCSELGSAVTYRQIIEDYGFIEIDISKIAHYSMK